MSQNALIEQIESEQLQSHIPEFRVGDTLKVHSKIIEGSKERVQAITGTVVARKGYGLSETFTLYRIAYGAAMDRVYPLHSPRLVKIEVMRKGKVKKAKLNHIRGAFGKKAKVKELLGAKKTKKAAVVETKQAPQSQEPKETQEGKDTQDNNS